MCWKEIADVMGAFVLALKTYKKTHKNGKYIRYTNRKYKNRHIPIQVGLLYNTIIY